MSRRVRLAVLAGGRSSEHDISLASAASVAAALDPARYDVRIDRDRTRRPLGSARGRRASRAARADDRRDVARSGRLGPGDARRRRRGAADPPRPVRRGRHRPGPLRAGRRRIRRRGRARVFRLHGQGRLQDADARRGHPRRAARRPPSRRPRREPVRLSRLRQAGEHGLVGRDLEGARRVRAGRGGGARAAPRREGDGRGVRPRAGDRGRRPRQPAEPGGIASRPGRRAQRGLVRLLVQVRGGWLRARRAAARA